MALGRKPIEIVNEGKHQLLAKAEEIISRGKDDDTDEIK